MKDYFKNFKYEHPGDVIWRSIELKILDKLLKGLKVKEPILDLGCGNGDVTKLLFGKKKVYGIDIVTEFIDDRTHYGDIANLDIPSDSYDTIFSNCVFEHIPELDKALKQVARILRKNGLFIFTVTSPFFKKNLLFNNPFYQWLRCKRAGIHNSLYIQEWYCLLKVYDLEIIKAEYFMDKHSALLFDKMAWINFLGLSHERYKEDMRRCYERDQGRWGSSGIAMIARKK